MKVGRIAAAALLLGAPACGKRGDPQPPLSRTPQAVRDLSVAQRGTDLVIRLLAPRTTTGGVRLDVHDVEILSVSGEGEFLKAALVEAHRAAPGESVVVTRPLPAPGTKLRVAARARAGGDRSALTSVTTFLAQPPPPEPTALTARLAPEGVMLAWTGTIPSPPPPVPAPSPAPAVIESPPTPSAAAPRPAPLSAGPAPFPSPSPSPIPRPTAPVAVSLPAPAPAPKPVNPGFRVYRRDPIASFDAPMNTAPVTGNAFEDRTATSGPRWCYVVRLAVSTEPLVESAPSNEVCVDVRDVAPPAPPLGVATLATPDAVEVSWSASPEADLAGYRVYRGREGGAAAKLADVPAGQTTWRDPTPGRGEAHFYTVTAFDQAGNESAPSRPAEGHLP